MRILDRYILRSILGIFFGTVITFAFLFILIDTFGNLEDFIEKKVPLGIIFQYYLAFLPVFVDPGAAHPTLAIFVLGLAFAGLTFLVKGPVGLGAGLLSGWLRSRPWALTWVYRTSGAVLIGLGLKLAFERRA